MTNPPRDDGSASVADRLRGIADEIEASGSLPVPSGNGGDRCSNGTTRNGGRPAARSSSKPVWQRDTDPVSVLAMLLRAGADRIHTEAPAMRAHAETMLTAADELVRLEACRIGSYKALEISQARLESLAEPEE